MNANDLPDAARQTVAKADDLLAPSLHAPRTTGESVAFGGALFVGELLALSGAGQVPIVSCPELLGAKAVHSRSVVDLQGAHVGRAVVLAFDGGSLERPIVLGVLQGGNGGPLTQAPAQVEVAADGDCLVVNAREQLVLRCGKASITLTRAGKVLIEGAYVSSRSTGVNRVRGGSVQLN